MYLTVADELYTRPQMPFSLEGTGETFEELEAELGMPEDTLSHSLRIFNKYAAVGEDPLFHKRAEYLRPLDKAPFAAFDVGPNGGAYYPAFTFGGLNTRPSGEVLNANGEIVPGLYAAGRTAAGIPRCAAGDSSGMSIGDATIFGRLAGRTAAAVKSF